MTASLHKLTAGSGYDYLTRQVAAQDSTEKGHASLTSYYTEKGEVPGRWVGTGLAALEMELGSPVSEVQMRALFGAGNHPDMEARLAALPKGATVEEVRHAARLGLQFKVHEAVTEFQQEVAIRCSQWAAANGLGSDATVPVDVRAEIRNELATARFQQRMGRSPSSLELSSEVARLTRNATTACAGFDVTFTPVKSVSALWAVAPPAMAGQIEEAHNAAVADALAYLEQRVLYSRRGAGGVRQVEVTGLVAAAFTHRDSRAGDPNLHTHVAIANKVQTLDGAWLAIDGRPLFAGMVSVSEVYNTQLEAHLVERLGVRFAADAARDPAKRPVREIVGVPAQLREAWSSRRAAIVARQAELAVDFQHDHYRPPTPAEAIALAQRATLETRQAKHEPRTLTEQRTTWAAQAAAVLGPDGVTQMLADVHAAPRVVGPAPTAEWVEQVAGEMVTRMGLSRASWTVWHLQAEASRRARERATNPDQSTQLTAQLLAAATDRCVALGGLVDPISDPQVLRRTDGESVYTTVGSRRFTSTAVIGAEQQILDAATLLGGRTASEADVSLALLSSTANGMTLTAGQVALVRQMATSGRRVQLALAAAGSGKTTALATLARAWKDSGGDVVGLAPSAVAARVLGDHVGQASTLAKVAWDLHHLPGDAQDLIGPDTLLIVDEAGMADTPTLAAVIGFAMARGASVRLIGDDQQLAAVGAGGVLRDIAHTHGAVHLTDVMRFNDPAEAAASLALRDGRPEALGFYLDQQRIHAGSDETVLRDALNGWQTHRAAGLDTVMLAGTRDQVAQLNRWARDHRLTATGGLVQGPVAVLSDGNLASVGDVIVTRLNDRRLSISATDWVKNGDRWTVAAVTPTGAIQAVHRLSGSRIELPPPYVTESVELGYAVTVHGAQGVTVDTTHAVLTGTESRQQLYVAMSRGRLSNHAYVQVVDDGGENSPIHPTTLRPVTTGDILETILARDGSSRSVTTETRTAVDPHTRLGLAVARYTDALSVAVEHLHAGAARELDRHADEVVDQLSSCAAWPTLRAHLLLLSATSKTSPSPLQLLRDAVDARELSTAQDPAAVLTWRLPHPDTGGPLPWLTGIPGTLANHDQWGPYLTARAAQVRAFAVEVRDAAGAIGRPVWALPGQTLTSSSVADVEVWRAAWQVEPADRRPTGPAQLGAAAHRWQRHLIDRLRPAHPVVIWTDLLRDIRHDLPRDPYAPVLAHRLASLHNAGVPITEHLAAAVADGPLPAEQPAAALWWRLSRHIATADAPALPAWEGSLVERLGYQAAADLEASPWWPHLAAAISHGVDQGVRIEDLIAPVADVSGFDDACQALLWRAHHLTTTPPQDEVEPPHPDELPPDGIEDIDWSTRTAELPEAARLRERTQPDFTDLELRQGFAAADRWADTPHTPQRLAQVTEAAAGFFETQLPGSWSHHYFSQRFAQDLAGDSRFEIGHAPAGWTHLVTDLRKQGFTTAELLAAGVATTTRQGNVIDRFRDRAIMPIHHDGVIVGFVGRRHPDAGDEQGPKYLNSPASPLFAKRDVLYGHHLLTHDAVPVIVEGPMDAIAVTLAGRGAFIGVAPLGTALTPEQALLLRGGVTPVSATDSDNAGHVAAENAFWLLAQHRHDPHRLLLPPGSDPAQLFEQHGPDALHDALTTATTPQAQLMLRDRATFLNPIEAGRQIAEIIAARPATTWGDSQHLVPEEQTRLWVARVNAWTTTPTAAADKAREQTRAMRRRLEQPAAERWQRWADTTGLVGAAEWPSIAARLDELHDAGANTNLLARRLARVPAAVMTATLALHRPGTAVEVDWRPWAEAVNPALCTADTWPGSQANLTRLQATGTNLTTLAQTLTGRDPEKVAAALQNVLRNHSTQIAQETSRYPEMAHLQVRRRVGREGSRSL
ncbi:relaxase domain-containing protein [Tessaracoccus sp. MC1679]|uniref:MobF family relaxase n=1 Tax=Tessaracoccus sp. MC1679 TaxID=2760313 RepID=UPI0015FF80BC|nr:MobF family relaxase [Tessaracoccus sp. MC1679]MBB1515995.1 relaxase domain-containing protein [Tessaracoccus sp. MC1679]